VSPDPDLVEKVRDLVGLFIEPPLAVAASAVHEKTRVQAISRTAQTLAMTPATPAGATYDYVRNGTSDLLAALDMASGKVITDIRSQHTPTTSWPSWPRSSATWPKTSKCLSS
jgi:hypothetical protein